MKISILRSLFITVEDWIKNLLGSKKALEFSMTNTTSNAFEVVRATLSNVSTLTKPITKFLMHILPLWLGWIAAVYLWTWSAGPPPGEDLPAHVPKDPGLAGREPAIGQDLFFRSGHCGAWSLLCQEKRHQNLWPGALPSGVLNPRCQRLCSLLKTVKPSVKPNCLITSIFPWPPYR